MDKIWDLLPYIATFIVSIPAAKYYLSKNSFSYDLDVEWYTRDGIATCYLQLNNPSDSIFEIKYITASASTDLEKSKCQLAYSIPIVRLDREIDLPSNFHDKLEFDAKIKDSFQQSFYVRVDVPFQRKVKLFFTINIEKRGRKIKRKKVQVIRYLEEIK